MVVSMTGFATKQYSLAIDAQTNVNITISIKTLNSRFFETTFKLPPAFSVLETDLIQVCKAKLLRGHCFFTMSVNPSNAFKTEVEPALPAVQSYVRALEKIKASTGVQGSVTISDLVQLPNIFTIEEKGIDQKTRDQIMSFVQELLSTLAGTRTKEGQSITKDVTNRIHELSRAIDAIAQRSARVMEEQKARVAQELNQLKNLAGDSVEAHKQVLYHELTKMDVNEEIVRFKNHLVSVQSILASSDSEKGKRIDFTTQELVREINTVASKNSDSTIGGLVITCKVELEKIREQAQNIV
jgi:uncharacterized protein (TIGR00255 family)